MTPTMGPANKTANPIVHESAELIQTSENNGNAENNALQLRNTDWYQRLQIRNAIG